MVLGTTVVVGVVVIVGEPVVKAGLDIVGGEKDAETALVDPGKAQLACEASKKGVTLPVHLFSYYTSWAMLLPCPPWYIHMVLSTNPPYALDMVFS